MSLNLNAALSSFIAASPRIIHHSKTQHWRKKTKTTSTDLSRDQTTICVWTQYANSCSSSAGRFVYGPTNVFIYLFYYYFLLCATSSPPFVTSAAPSSVLRWRRLCTVSSLTCCQDSSCHVKTLRIHIYSDMPWHEVWRQWCHCCWFFCVCTDSDVNALRGRFSVSKELYCGLFFLTRKNKSQYATQ